MLVIIKYKRKKKKITNGPNDARRVVWAHFLPLKATPVPYPSGPIVCHSIVVVVATAAAGAAFAVTVLVVVVVALQVVCVVSKKNLASRI